jgi:CRP-like cAMP-binding protein
LQPQRNHLLAKLDGNAPAAFLSALRQVDLPQETILFELGRHVEHVYWLHSGAVSLVVDLEDGTVVEAAITGFDGVCGASFALTDQPAVHRAVVQIAGRASAIKSEVLRKLVKEHEELRDLLMQYDQFVLAQAQQSAACNAKHQVDNRLARWLLRARHVTGSNELPLTQEFLSDMLAVRRTSVSLAAHKLMEAGLIHYRRGHIKVTNPQGLREVSCECYQSLNLQYERMFGDPRPN